MSHVYEELACAVAEFQNRVAQGERGLLDWAGGFLFYGEQSNDQRPRLAAYCVARKDFSKDVLTARDEVLRMVPLPFLEIADYVEMLSPHIGPSLVVKERGGIPCFLQESTKSHEDLQQDMATLEQRGAQL